MARISPIFLAVGALGALGGCGGKSGGEGNILASLDQALVGNDTDPALTSALADQIAVDPTLANQSNRNAIRTPPTPTRDEVPAPAPGQPALQPAAASVGSGDCGLNGPFRTDAGYARRLPPSFPLYPGARVTDASGYDRGACRMRAVTFNAPAAAPAVLDWYAAQAARAGFQSDRQARGGDQILAGSKGDEAYYLIVTPKGGTSDVALIANGGR
jgi:hypothetical protein